MTPTFTQFDAIFNILLLVIVVTIIARRLRIPYTVALIFAGVMATLYPRFSLFRVSPEIFVSLLLPPIIFEETLKLDIDGFLEDSNTILSYAIGGTLIMALAVALFAYLIWGFTPMEAFLLGIIIAPTDPVAVIATIRRLGVIKRFQLIVAGESLFNDGVAIVVYSILVSAISLDALTPSSILRISIISVLGGVIVGVVGGYIVHLIFRWTDDKFVEVLLSFITAFGVFRMAEEMGGSGVLATVLAGLIINYRYRRVGGIGKESIEMLDAMWEFVGFTASCIAFIFVGMYLDPKLLARHLLPVAALTLFILTARYLMVDCISRAMERFGGKQIPHNWKFGIFWSGLRGAVSIVLVLGISGLNLPHVEKMTALTFGVVLATNVLQGLTISTVVRRWALSANKGAEAASMEEKPDGHSSSRVAFRRKKNSWRSVAG
jgi:CPA1 family monovalent cation:H+ antiporter